MPKLTQLTGEIVKSYLERFPKVPSMTLAKKIYKENVEVFSNLDAVRTMIRRYRGKHGKQNLKDLKDKRFLNQKPEIPKSQIVSKKPYQIPVCNNRIMVVSDIHVPFHDIKAIKAAVRYGKEKKVNCIYINGDLLDFYAFSRFEKDPRQVNVPYEIKCGRDILAYFRAAFPKALIVWYWGNHCWRFYKWMLLKAPELLDVPEFDLYNLLGCRENNIIIANNNRGARAGKLALYHGHEFHGSGGVAPARKYFLAAKTNILCSHVHKTDEYTEPNVNKEIYAGFTIGCLSDLDPDYAPINKYNHGFAIVRILDKEGNFSVENKRIINGRVM